MSRKFQVQYEKEPLKWRVPGIKTLAMLKMEKNFIAHLEKHYSRQPYADEHQTIQFLIKRIEEETGELTLAFCRSLVSSASFSITDLVQMREECADISNLVDFLFERLARAEISLLLRSAQARPGCGSRTPGGKIT